MQGCVEWSVKGYDEQITGHGKRRAGTWRFSLLGRSCAVFINYRGGFLAFSLAQTEALTCLSPCQSGRRTQHATPCRWFPVLPLSPTTPDAIHRDLLVNYSCKNTHSTCHVDLSMFLQSPNPNPQKENATFFITKFDGIRIEKLYEAHPR